MKNHLRQMLESEDVYEGKWMAVYLETVPGSLERLCAIIVVQGDDGDVRVLRTLPHYIVVKIFGPRSKGIDLVITSMVESLTGHLENNSLDTWVPGSTGFKLGDVRTSGAVSIEGLVEKAILLTTSLPTMYSDETERQKYFSTELKNNLLLINQNLKRFIDQPYELNNKKVK